MRAQSAHEVQIAPEHDDDLRLIEISNNVARTLDQKAKRARYTGTISFLLTIVIGLAITSLFLFSHGLEPPSETKTRATATGGISPVGPLAKVLGENLKGEQITETLVSQDIYFQIANTAIVRVGSVLVAIFLIQILTGFARYYYRIAEHLSACADIVRLGRGDARIIKELSPILLPSVEFGKIPTSPVQAVLDKAMDTIEGPCQKDPYEIEAKPKEHITCLQPARPCGLGAATETEASEEPAGEPTGLWAAVAMLHGRTLASAGRRPKSWGLSAEKDRHDRDAP